MVPEGWYLVQHCANVVEPGTKGRGTGTKLMLVGTNEISSMDVFGIPRANFSF